VWPVCLFGRPFAFREGLLIWPWTFFLFTWSAAAYGPCFTLLITWITEKVTRKKLVKDNVIELLAKISGWMIFTYTIAKIADTTRWANITAPGLGQTLADFYTGNAFYGYWILFAEIVLCGVLPAIILISRTAEKKPHLAGNRLHPGRYRRLPEPLGHGVPGHGRAHHAL
jgi:p-aminobenzoyl-glutamate transporter AbgT